MSHTICPMCGETMHHSAFDWLEGYGETDFTDTCTSCDYTLEFSYGVYTETRNGIIFVYNYKDALKMQNGEMSLHEFATLSAKN